MFDATDCLGQIVRYLALTLLVALGAVVLITVRKVLKNRSTPVSKYVMCIPLPEPRWIAFFLGKHALSILHPALSSA